MEPWTAPPAKHLAVPSRFWWTLRPPIWQAACVHARRRSGRLARSQRTRRSAPSLPFVRHLDRWEQRRLSPTGCNRTEAGGRVVFPWYDGSSGGCRFPPNAAISRLRELAHPPANPRRPGPRLASPQGLPVLLASSPNAAMGIEPLTKRVAVHDLLECVSGGTHRRRGVGRQHLEGVLRDFWLALCSSPCRRPRDGFLQCPRATATATRLPVFGPHRACTPGRVIFITGAAVGAGIPRLGLLMVVSVRSVDAVAVSPRGSVGRNAPKENGPQEPPPFVCRMSELEAPRRERTCRPELRRVTSYRRPSSPLTQKNGRTPERTSPPSGGARRLARSGVLPLVDQTFCDKTDGSAGPHAPRAHPRAQQEREVWIRPRQSRGPR